MCGKSYPTELGGVDDGGGGVGLDRLESRAGETGARVRPPLEDLEELHLEVGVRRVQRQLHQIRGPPAVVGLIRLSPLKKMHF